HGPERLRYVRGALESEGVPALPVIIRCPADPALGIASVDTRDQSFQGTGDLVNGSRIGWLTPFWQHARLDPRYAFIRTWRQLDERFMLSRPCGAHPLHAIRRRFTLRNARLRTYLHRDRKPNGVIAPTRPIHQRDPAKAKQHRDDRSQSRVSPRYLVSRGPAIRDRQCWLHGCILLRRAQRPVTRRTAPRRMCERIPVLSGMQLRCR